MTHCARDRNCLGKFAILTITLLTIAPTFVHAQKNFDIDVRNTGKAIVIKQDQPGYPGNRVRRGQEGWVRMSYVVTADGRAIDPIVLNSSGGSSFEDEARKIMPEWRFQPGATELPYNIVNIRSEIYRGRDAATSNFIRRTKRILTHLHNEEVDAARKQADEAHSRGGWNLYESTMLWLMLGRVNGAEENYVGKLEMYSRSLELGNTKALPGDNRVELLEKIFLLQSRFQHYAAALATHENLKKAPGNKNALERTADRAKEIETILSNEVAISARATIYSPCDCNEGEPLWHYVPARRAFSFGNVNGNVERFEARCEGQRISGSVEPGQTWSLAPEWGHCRVIVFGDNGSTFDFNEHMPGEEGGGLADEAAVARNHVLDRRSRSQ